MVNPFFQNKGPLKIDKILSSIKSENKFENLDDEILDIKDLVSASNKDLTFFHSKKYQHQASTTKAGYCITTQKLSNLLPNKCKPIEVDNVLVSTAMVTSIFYPNALTDDFDINTLNIEKTSFKNSVKLSTESVTPNDTKFAIVAQVVLDVITFKLPDNLKSTSPNGSSIDSVSGK